MRPALLSLLLALAACAPLPATAPRQAPTYDPVEKSIAELQADLAAGRISSERLLRLYLDRIEQLDRDGPALRSVLAVNPDALQAARDADAERRRGVVRGPLHGIPVLIKDNIETVDPLPTTAGSLALVDNFAAQDAPVVARLRAAGAIVLGKANLSEWANFRSVHSTSGWSAVGGLTRNPYLLDRSACGSSTGSAVAVAASLAAAALGTETNGSIVCPAAVTGLVGFKPTLGLLSRRGIVPIAHSQDTAGPIARSVADAALLLATSAGSDQQDPATAAADAHPLPRLEALLQGASLRGKRLGVMRFAMGYHPGLDRLFEDRLETLREAGAEIVDVETFDTLGTILQHQFTVLLTEFKADLEAYLASTPPAVRTRSIEALIAFNESRAERELLFFGQDLFTLAQATVGLDAPEYLNARTEARRLAGPEGIDRLLAEHDLDALIAPTTAPAASIDLVVGDHFLGSASTLAAVAGYPHLTVPMGQVWELPVGLSLLGTAWSDAQLLRLGHAIETLLAARRPPRFQQDLQDLPAAAAGMRPLERS